jgi:hypothetical protein
MRGVAIILLGLAAALFLHHRWEPPTLLVHSQLPQLDDPSVQPHLLVAPCPVMPMNLPDYSERSA